MTVTDTPEQFAERFRLAREMYDRIVRPRLTPADDGKYVAINIDTGEYEIDADDYAASERLFARNPNARGCLLCVGQPATYRIRAAGS